jgi:Transcription termination factor nusG
MPILSEERSIHPPDLLALARDPLAGDLLDGAWWAIHTKARQEKAVGRQLLGWGTPFYLPLIRKAWLYRGRRVSSYAPLFPGYLFLCGSEEQCSRARTTNRVAKVLRVLEPSQLVEELRQIQRLIEAGLPLTFEDRLAPGKRVRVRHGALAGLEGTVLTRRGKTRLVVSVNFIQQGASVEVEDVLLEPLE